VICQSCGVEAPTKHVVFYQNIGALVMRFHKEIEGNLCKSCIHKYFWEFTLITLFLGWWGVISFVMTLFFYIPNNIIRYLLSLSLKPVPPGAAVAELTEEAMSRLAPYAETIVVRLKSGESLEYVAKDIAIRAGVTPGQVVLYLRALIVASKDSSN
jgi:hypothetical protein